MPKRDQKMFPLGRGAAISYLRSEALQQPDTAEIIGMCKGVIADKRVNQREAEALLKWVENNQASARKWPCNVIYEQISVALSDHYLDVEEQQELFAFLSKICADGDFEGKVKLSKGIPYDDSIESLRVEKTAFCLTGEFASGTRDCCERMIEKYGGIIKKNPVKNSVLVVGGIASSSWKFGDYGNKVKKAIDYRKQKYGVVIIPEDSLIELLEGYVNEN